MRMRACSVVVCLALGCVPVSAQSLAEASAASKQARAESAAKAGAPLWVPTNSASEPSATGVVAAPISVAEVAAAKARGEDWWRTQSLALRRTAAASHAAAMKATLKLGVARANYDSAKNINQQLLFRPELVAARETFEPLAIAGHADATAVATFEELARRVNVPASWLRAQ
jgi:hypothetical protein